MDNEFQNKGDGDQNIGQGDGAIGKQVNISQTITGNGNVSAGRDVHIGQYHAPTPSPVIPRDQPALDAYFLGRDRELAELLNALHPGRVVTVCGPGGMGKSALAAQAVSKLEESRFPDGMVFHTFYGHPETDQALQSIIRAFGLEPEPPLDFTLQRVLSGRQALLILDGAEDAHDLPAVLNLRGSCGVLITSRSPKDAQFTRLELHALEDKPAVELLLAWSGQAIDEHTVQRICTVLGGLPVAVRIVGHYLRHTGESAAEYLDWLEKAPLQELDQGEHKTQSVAVLLRRSVEQLSDDARLVLGIAGCLAFAPIAREPITALLKGDARHSRAAINELVRYGLQEKEGECWQIGHALIHTYARTELPLSREPLERLARYYIAFCETASAEGVKGYARLDAERAHCLRLMESCLASKLWEEVKLLVRAIDTYLDRQENWTEYLSAFEMCLTAARQTGDREDEGWCLNGVGYTCARRGEYKKAIAYFEQCLLIDRELGDHNGESTILNNIGNIYREQGEYEQAMQYLEQSLSIAREVGDRKAESVTLASIGYFYSEQGDQEQALSYYKQSLPIRWEVEDKRGEGVTLNNIASIYYAQGKQTKAIEYYKQALAIHLAQGGRAGEAKSCWNIGRIYEDMNSLAKAEKYISQAVQIAEQIDHPFLEKFREGLARVREARQAAQERNGMD